MAPLQKLQEGEKGIAREEGKLSVVVFTGKFWTLQPPPRLLYPPDCIWRGGTRNKAAISAGQKGTLKKKEQKKNEGEKES